MNIIEQINNDFSKFITKHFKIDENITKKCEFTLNIDESKQNFGDINSNCAMILAKELGKSPREIAISIIDCFKNKNIEKIEVAGPGFLNFFLTQKAYQELCKEIYTQKEDFFKPKDLHKKNYNLEFVSVNPTGPVHFGHGRGAIIGDVLANILNFLGHNATREYYINDAGAQITKLGTSFKIRCKQELEAELQIPATRDDQDHTNRNFELMPDDQNHDQHANTQMPEDAYHGQYLIELAKEAINELGKDKIKLEIFCNNNIFFENYAKDKMLQMIKKTVENYGVNFDVWFSEKTLHKSGQINDALKILEKNGYLFEQEGALWFKSTEFGDDKDRVIIKSDGQPTYLAPDVAYLQNKAQRGFDHLIMMLGHDHHSYEIRLEGIRKALKLENKLTVILFQLVKMKASGELVRMSKRAGNLVSLDDIIELVGKDVARFFYLNRKADAQLEFDLDLASKKNDENPVYYIQYAYVRTKSILEKAALIPEFSKIDKTCAHDVQTAEYFILRKITALKELLKNISTNLQTHLLAYYTLELATTFHSYYSKNRVIDQENITQTKMRLLIVNEVANTLGLCLDLMGIEKPEKM